MPSFFPHVGPAYIAQLSLNQVNNVVLCSPVLWQLSPLQMLHILPLPHQLGNMVI
jgi:hypothetical protein